VKLALFALAALVLVSAAAATPSGPDGTTESTRASVTIPLAPAFAPTDLVPPARADWATNGGDYGQTRYSTLNEITKSNVRRLKAKWHIHLNGSATGSK
jgi:glucose dehydrogenase